jgi:hypothetical protein
MFYCRTSTLASWTWLYPNRVKGWTPPYKSGVPFPMPPEEIEFTDAKWPIDKDHAIPICCGDGNSCCRTLACTVCCGKGQCSHLSWSFCHMMKTVGLMTCAVEGTCPLCAPCCKPLCCVNNSAPQFPHPRGVTDTKMFNGHPVEDIRNPKYLWGGEEGGVRSEPTKVDTARGGG